jgi:hypothetical protein
MVVMRDARAAGLSDRSLKAITDMINSARMVEGLQEDAGSDTGTATGTTGAA